MNQDALLSSPSFSDAARPGPRRKLLPQLRNYPDLVLAATATTGELDTTSETFAGVMACLETLSRLRLGTNGAFMLAILVRDGPQTMGALSTRTRISTASMTGFADRLAALGLLTFRRADRDRRVIYLTATDAARKVMASIVGLTALGQAASLLLQTKAAFQIAAQRGPKSALKPQTTR